MSEDGEDDTDDGSDPLSDALGEEDGGDGDAEREDPVDAFVEDVTERPDEAGEDPFERMGAGPVPEGDPFERLEGDGEDAGATSPAGREGDAGMPDEAPASESREVDRSSDPFGGFESAEGDPFGEGESVFERVDVGTVDPEEVWDGMDGEDGEELGGGEDVDAAVDEVPGRRYVEVSKHSYCERCEYFSGPPEVSCSHEGTQILEFTDMETVRLVDCPVVAERQALEDEG